MSLHSVPIGGPIEVFLMQDQPEAEARVGAPNPIPYIVAQADGLSVARMPITVKYGPDLVALLEGVQRLSTTAAQAMFSCPINCRSGQGVRHTPVRNRLY
jgi:hypothetical protein